MNKGNKLPRPLFTHTYSSLHCNIRSTCTTLWNLEREYIPDQSLYNFETKYIAIGQYCSDCTVNAKYAIFTGVRG